MSLSYGANRLKSFRITFVLIVITALFLWSHFVFAYCNNCGGNMGCCRCPGEAKCLYPYATCEQACGLTGGSGGGGVSVPTAPRTMQGAMMQGLMNGLMQGLSNPGPVQQAQPIRQLTPEEIEAQRQAQIAQQKAEEERQRKIREKAEEDARIERERIAALDREAESALALLGHPAAPKPGLSDEDLMASPKIDPKKVADDKLIGNKPKPAGYTKGFEDASQCFSPNAGPYCVGASADTQQSCLGDYNAGYALGSKQREISMQEAVQAGVAAGTGGGADNGAADPRAAGGCRIQWIESYNHGYFQGKHANAR